MEQQDGARVSTAYLRFAEDEVRDRSPLYGELSRGVASDPEVIGFLLTLPREKRQPNLFLSTVRYLFGTPAGWDQFRSCVLHEKDALRAAMLARSTQTNEPGRCAALLRFSLGSPSHWLCSKSARLQLIAERGRMGWQRASGYNWRALVEADIGRYKRVIGDALHSRTEGRQTTEVGIAVASLNRMLELGRPEYIRLV
jgi:hypothetical protein